MSDASDRAAAIASLLLGTVPEEEGGEAPDAPSVTRTGRELESGGDEARLLISPAHLSYNTPHGRQYVDAVVGDVVLLSKVEAKRLDDLGATVDPDYDLEELEEQRADGLLTDEQIKTGRAEELVAYVAQNPDERERVKAIEEQRGNKARSSVLGACERDEEAEAEALLEAERRQEEAVQAQAQAEAEGSSDAPAGGDSTDSTSK